MWKWITICNTYSVNYILYRWYTERGLNTESSVSSRSIAWKTVKHGDASVCTQQIFLGGCRSLLLAPAAAFALLLCLAAWPKGAGEGHSTDGATGHLSAGHLVMDRWRKRRRRLAINTDTSQSEGVNALSGHLYLWELHWKLLQHWWSPTLMSPWTSDLSFLNHTGVWKTKKH